jgi:hypothetical protein
MLCCATVAALSVFAGTALAEGGNSIATGPVVVYGQQEFGNTAFGAHLKYPDGWNQFFNLKVVAGDQLTIDWESVPSSNGQLLLYPAGTSDYTLGGQGSVAAERMNSEGKNEMHYTASVAGTLPLVVCTKTGPGATYNFTAYVKHAVSLAVSRLPGLKHRQMVTVQAHTPEGGAISDPSLDIALEAKGRGGSWKRLGSAAVGNSVAKIKAKVPKALWHQNVSLRATASGSSYLTTRSELSQVKVS